MLLSDWIWMNTTPVMWCGGVWRRMKSIFQSVIRFWWFRQDNKLMIPTNTQVRAQSGRCDVMDDDFKLPIFTNATGGGLVLAWNEIRSRLTLMPPLPWWNDISDQLPASLNLQKPWWNGRGTIYDPKYWIPCFLTNYEYDRPTKWVGTWLFEKAKVIDYRLWRWDEKGTLRFYSSCGHQPTVRQLVYRPIPIMERDLAKSHVFLVIMFGDHWPYDPTLDFDLNCRTHGMDGDVCSVGRDSLGDKVRVGSSS